MKLALIRTDFSNTPKIVVGEINNVYGRIEQLAIGIIYQTNSDFDLNNPFIIANETDSIQYRPKLLYKDKFGNIFYNKKKDRYGGTERVFLNNKEVMYVEVYISAAKLFLEKNMIRGDDNSNK